MKHFPEEIIAFTSIFLISDLFPRDSWALIRNALFLLSYVLFVPITVVGQFKRSTALDFPHTENDGLSRSRGFDVLSAFFFLRWNTVNDYVIPMQAVLSFFRLINWLTRSYSEETENPKLRNERGEKNIPSLSWLTSGATPTWWLASLAHTKLKQDRTLASKLCHWGPYEGVARYPLDQLIQPGRDSRELPVWNGNNHKFIQKLFILAGSRSVKSQTFSTVCLLSASTILSSMA